MPWGSPHQDQSGPWGAQTPEAAIMMTMYLQIVLQLYALSCEDGQQECSLYDTTGYAGQSEWICLFCQRGKKYPATALRRMTLGVILHGRACQHTSQAGVLTVSVALHEQQEPVVHTMQGTKVTAQV